ncbi:hypothetical protein JYU34_009477 [Plutella xylostella]|uniref:SUN domain-containing protein n=1 Tax=Plutella xylostella TaxID=51655 RepID=A0ABQ7QMU4_PLUXY|nr:hypothetical protein JYU34_009477 [Plutella xylostella]
MDFDLPAGNSCLQRIFRVFVCGALSLLLGMHLYTYQWGRSSSESFTGEFSDLKYVIMQLTRGLTEVNRKHERLQSEMERISQVLPGVAAAASRARAALEPAMARSGSEKSFEIVDFDHQMIDFALESAGARVLSTGDTADHALPASALGWALHAVTSWMCKECLGARAMLRPGSLPGECWAFKGAVGEATVLLLGTVVVSGFSIEHIPPQIAPTKEISSAPRHITLEGLETPTDPYPFDFGSFEYDIQGKPIQYFEVRKRPPRGYNIVRIKFLSNWGNPVFTCVYRVRIHGSLAPGQGVQYLDEAQIENE